MQRKNSFEMMRLKEHPALRKANKATESPVRVTHATRIDKPLMDKIDLLGHQNGNIVVKGDTQVKGIPIGTGASCDSEISNEDHSSSEASLATAPLKQLILSSNNQSFQSKNRALFNQISVEASSADIQRKLEASKGPYERHKSYSVGDFGLQGGLDALRRMLNFIGTPRGQRSPAEKDATLEYSPPAFSQ